MSDEDSVTKPRYDKLISGEDFNCIKHNPLDYESFREFQDKLNSNFEQLEEQKFRSNKIANLKKWDEGLPRRWKDAKLSLITRPGAKEAVQKIVKALKADRNNVSSFFLQGGAGAGKTFIGYATVRAYISMGLISPSQIKIISEDALMAFALSGFEGRSRFDEILSGPAKLFLFDSVGAKTSYSEKERAIWEQMIDHVYSKSFSAIFTSSNSASTFSDILSPSGESKFKHLVSGRVLSVRTEEGAPQQNLGSLTDVEKRIQDRDAKINSVFD